MTRLEDIGDLVGHGGAWVKRDGLPLARSGPPSPDNATAVNRILKANATELACPLLRESRRLPNWLPKRNPKTCLTSRDGGI